MPPRDKSASHAGRDGAEAGFVDERLDGGPLREAREDARAMIGAIVSSRLGGFGSVIHSRLPLRHPTGKSVHTTRRRGCASLDARGRGRMLQAWQRPASLPP
jgi:hypothetical protein